MHACLLLFPTTSTSQVVCLRLGTTPFPITISSHIHVFHPLQASSTALLANLLYCQQYNKLASEMWF